MNYFFDWERILMNKLPLHFLLEVLLRSVVMFLFLLTILKLTGKRGVKQLSVFEMVIIISLGSAAGDPMFYEEVGLIPCILVLAIVLILYRVVTWLTAINPWLEKLIKGKTELLIQDGKFCVSNFKKGTFAQEEFFAELRQKNIEHLGQIKRGYIEITGDLTTFYYEDADVIPGLPIIPELFDKKSEVIPTEGLYSCSHCGNTINQKPGTAECSICHKEIWVKAIKTRRIT